MRGIVFPRIWPFAAALFLVPGFSLSAHIADEIAVKTTIVFDGDAARLGFDISSGVIFSTHFLGILDPDKSKTFEENHVRAFAEFFAESLRIRINGLERKPEFARFDSSPWDFFAAGVSSIVLEYGLPPFPAAPEDSSLDYEFSFYPNVAVYSLSVENPFPGELAILEDRRNEFLQDRAVIRFTRDPVQIAALTVPEKAAETTEVPARKARNFALWLREIFESSGLLAFIRGEERERAKLPLLFLIIAAAVGFLHAFTPGHGKALVGAFLIANRGTVFHAFLLGLVITVTHTLSIYCFGLSASAAAKFFLPGEFIPLLTILSGAVILGVGLYSFIGRLSGRRPGHAHLIPNLRILRRESVNILIDGRAAEAGEALRIALDGEDWETYLKAAGAEDFNLCSPGCSGHGGRWPVLEERRRQAFFKLALGTGAVDGVVSLSERSARNFGKTGTRAFTGSAASVLEAPGEFLRRAAKNYTRRGEIVIPEERISWPRIISFGITGGIVPCPDALAVLLVSISAGKILWGMGIIFFFSLGLAAALILTGTLLVLTRRMLGRNRGFALIEEYLPRASSLFIMALGILMIKSSWVW
jgi:ABC-type nickel/cobalt efflux system permease component RcnA